MVVIGGVVVVTRKALSTAGQFVALLAAHRLFWSVSAPRRLAQPRVSFSSYVQKHLPEWLPVDPLLDRCASAPAIGKGQHEPRSPQHLASGGSGHGCHLLSRSDSRAPLLRTGSKPLQIWEKQVRNGHIKRITDNDIQSSVLEIMSTNISTTFVSCPADNTKTLGIKLPFLVMIIKNVRAGCPPASRGRAACALGLPACCCKQETVFFCSSRRQRLHAAHAGRRAGPWPTAPRLRAPSSFGCSPCTLD